MLKDSACEMVPSYYTYYTTFRCNLHCAACYQKTQRKQLMEELSLKEATEMFERVKSLTRVNLIGGEVFIRQDTLDLLEYFDERGVITYVTTNGTLLNEEKIERLFALQHLLGVTISLDALGDSYKSIRRKGPSSDRILGIIRKLAEHIEVRVNSVLLTENIDQFEPLVEAITKAGAVMLKVQLQIAHSPLVADCTERSVREWMRFPVSCLYPRENVVWEPKVLKTAIRQIRHIAKSYGLRLMIFPEELAHHLNDYATEMVWRNYWLYCEGFSRISRKKVFPNGDIMFCEGLGLSLGNLRQQSPEEIWHSPILKTFRKHFEHAGGLPICGRCCRVIVGSKRTHSERQNP